MNKVVLAAAAAVLALSARADPQGMRLGVIALSDSPVCDFFMVRIDAEFSLSFGAVVARCSGKVTGYGER